MKRVIPFLAGLAAVVLAGCTSPATPSGQAAAVAGDNSNLLTGNPSRADKDENNLLLTRKAHAMSYNAGNGGPNWVSWHLGKSDLGPASRGNFLPDPLLPKNLQVRPSDYTGSGYDRGHVCPSGDRTRDSEYNRETFVMSNMLPQAAALNQQVWKDLEEYERYLVTERKEELYVVAGGSGSAGRIGKGKINVPDVCWKIILILPEGNNDLKRMDANTRVLAVSMPNRDRQEIADSKWTDWITTVDQLQKTTGYDFLSALPDDVEKALEQKRDAGRAEAASAATPSTAVKSTPAKSTPAKSTSAPASASVRVWVNTSSGVYHMPGGKYYGKTARGEYMTEAEAKARGYRAAQ